LRAESGVISYIPIGIQLLLTVILAGVILGLATWLGTPRHSKTDLSSYECGVDPLDASDKRFTIRFYMVAMLFILFDIETAFLYPWATVFRDMGMEGFVGMAIFLAVLTAGFLYCWRRGALDWD
jgi:NADH-quinone oxidoreductase subunit A